MRLALMAVAAAVPAVAHAEFLSGTQVWDGKMAPRTAALFRPAMLDVHNAARKAYGVPPLTWSEALAGSARTYAMRLAATRTFAHDKQVGVSPPQGENLYMGTRGAFSYAAMVQLWVDERKDFRPGRFPDVVRSGHWSRVGHYTQIIWPTTTTVGCALASNATDDYLVCRYAPAGNWFGSKLK